MLKLTHKALWGLAILQLLTACNSSSTPATQALSVDDQAATIVAMTFQAATQSAVNNPPTPLPLATATFDQPRLYIRANSSCRTGIGSNFKVVANFPTDTTVEMLGKDSAQGAWLIQMPDGAGSCWVLAQDSSPTGSFENLPEITPQPVAGQPPSAPSTLRWPYSCTYEHDVVDKLAIALSWTNTAQDANGFRVYRNETLVADVPANVNTYSDETDVTTGSSITYSVEAYNDAGVSPRLAQTITSICKVKTNP